MLTRIAKNSESDLRISLFDSDGLAATGLSVTIEVLASDGTELIAAGTSADEVAGEDGTYAYTLTPTETGQIDRITASWTADFGSGNDQVQTTYHDIIGAHYFALAELRELEPVDDSSVYTAAQLAEARDHASYALEEACNDWTWTERFRSHSFDGDGSRTLILPYVGIQEIRSVTLDGTAVDVSTLDLRPGGVLRRQSNVWTCEAEIIVNFTQYGTVSPEPRVSRAARLVAREILFSDALDGEGSAIPERATAWNTEAGNFSFVTAGVGSAAFDLPEVNQVVNDYRVWRYG